MFEDYGLDSIMAVATGAFTAIKYILIAGVVFGLPYVIFRRMRYKHKIVLKKLTQDLMIIKEDKYRYTKKKDGTKVIKLLKNKLTLPVPPPKAIRPYKNNIEYVEAYLVGNSQVLYVTDDTNIESIQKNVTNFKPIDTNYEVLYAAELKESAAWNKDSWQKNIPLIVGAAAFIIFVFLTYMYWGKLLQPAADAQAQNVKFTENFIELEKMQAETYRAMTMMWSKITGESIPANATISQTIANAPIR